MHPTLQNKDSEGNSEQLDGRVDSLATNGQFVDIFNRLTAETWRTIYGHNLTVGICKRQKTNGHFEILIIP